MFNWKKKKCKICDDPLPADNAVMRLETSEGIHEIDLCDPCADFFEQSAEVLQKIRHNTRSEQEDDE